MICDLQKANILKRVSAYILDLIMLTIVITGAAFALSSIFDYDSYSEKLTVELEYVKASSLSENKYVITLVSGNKYYALSHKNNTVSAVRVTVSNGVITSEVTEDLVWEYSNKKLCYESNGTTYYLHAQSSNSWWGWASTPTLTISSSNSTEVTFSSNKLKVGSSYLRYSGNKISLNKSATTTYLFLEDEV